MTQDNIGLYGDGNDNFTNCIVLQSNGKGCSNEISMGINGYCREHWFNRLNKQDEPERLLSWKYSMNEVVKCEVCRLSIPLMVLAEHQADCKGQNGESVSEK